MKYIIAFIGLIASTTAFADDATNARIEHSAALCEATEWRREILEKIAYERSLVRTTGVVNLREMGEWQNTLRSTDKDIAEARASLRTLRVKSLACTDRRVVAYRAELAAQPADEPQLMKAQF